MDNLIIKIYKKRLKYDYELFQSIMKDTNVFKSKTSNSLNKFRIGVKNDFSSDRVDLVHNLMKADQVRFAFAKTAEEVSQLNKISRDIPFTEFRTEALKINDKYNVQHLRTEYNTAYNRMLNTDEYLDKSKRYKYAKWKQIKRATAREDHKYLDGKTFLVSELVTIPPMGYNCGCELIYSNDMGDLRTPEYFKSNKEEWDLAVQQGFNTNPAKTGEIFGSAYDDYKKSISLKDQGFTLSMLDLKLLSLDKDIKWECKKYGNQWVIEEYDLNGDKIKTFNLNEEVFLNIKSMIRY